MSYRCSGCLSAACLLEKLLPWLVHGLFQFAQDIFVHGITSSKPSGGLEALPDTTEYSLRANGARFGAAISGSLAKCGR